MKIHVVENVGDYKLLGLKKNGNGLKHDFVAGCRICIYVLLACAISPPKNVLLKTQYMYIIREEPIHYSNSICIPRV